MVDFEFPNFKSKIFEQQGLENKAFRLIRQTATISRSAIEESKSAILKWIGFRDSRTTETVCSSDTIVKVMIEAVQKQAISRSSRMAQTVRLISNWIRIEFRLNSDETRTIFDLSNHFVKDEQTKAFGIWPGYRFRFCWLAMSALQAFRRAERMRIIGHR